MFSVKQIVTLCFILFLGFSLHAKVIYVSYYPNGEKKVEMTKLKKGVVRIDQYYPSGDLMETGYSKHSQKQGQWTRYNTQGVIVDQVYFHNNVRIGSWNHYNEWTQNTFKVSYQNGTAVSYKLFDDSGQLIASGDRMP